MTARQADRPTVCPVCDAPYDSVSVHTEGLMVNLIENDRYRRVCFEPVDGPRIRFFHHTHEQAGDTQRTEDARRARDTDG